MLKNKKDIILIGCMFLGLTFLGFGYKYLTFNSQKKVVENINSENKQQKEDDSSENNKQISEIYVHIDGEVKNPGVYKMKIGDRVNDAIQAAGGLTENADKGRINLATKLRDEMKIHISKIGETNSDLSNESKDDNSDGNNSKLININTASKEELCKLTGIGENKAKLIIEYREKKKFTKIEDITKVSGIGKKTFEKIKNDITVD
ncbi:MAG: helix-hairpin-helix domain-containing protein [Clostridiales bacterium]|uniref:helix-hairpin-helix domain-containing protein n=1 Tax=unclassified Parvimonas TaxID=1151464 RepID=UPI001CAC7D6E|nr:MULTISPECIES: helix-hairpin-helix domain-containing protein [unclassified Parvimonas]MBF0988007.1 helix-hairpin-helix domain-containing protein [Clostridiales bacterium]MEB3024691.1 helix-hairpin-helix domain-containing protein [Parvimonas sp. M13]MEB3072218.1 helix-hairpin-helix domain-containing protein [Parvimonas sp. C2]MEB3088836.1 helix-hairpin-helix domain-containing protein [Parvimonas sp. M20]